MARRKSKPEHDEMVLDESVRPMDRAEAIFCLGLDGRTEHEAAFASLVGHPHADIRGQAVQALLAWARAAYLPLGLQMVVGDPDPDARCLVMLGLEAYARRVPEAVDDVCRALAQVVRHDEECQLEAYQAITGLLRKRTGLRLHPARFDPERDIDWDLLAPYAEPPPGPH